MPTLHCRYIPSFAEECCLLLNSGSYGGKHHWIQPNLILGGLSLMLHLDDLNTKMIMCKLFTKKIQLSWTNNTWEALVPFSSETGINWKQP